MTYRINRTLSCLTCGFAYAKTCEYKHNRATRFYKVATQTPGWHSALVQSGRLQP